MRTILLKKFLLNCGILFDMVVLREVKMKILLINKFLYRKGGAEISALNMGKLLATKEYKVILWGMKHPENPDYIHKDLFVSYVYFNRAMGILEMKKHLVIKICIFMKDFLIMEPLLRNKMVLLSLPLIPILITRKLLIILLLS